MWGKIGGQGKVPLARSAIGAALADYKDKVAFGVIAFGHGSASGCADVEVRAKPGELTATNRNKVLLNFNPRTSRPLASALTEAAKLGQANRGIDAILITDGSDNCKMDTCASAKALKQAVPGLRMHVIGFDPKPSQSSRRWLAWRRHRGQFTTVSDASELKKALTAALDIAATPLPARAPAPPAVAAPAAPAAPPPASTAG